MKNFIFALTFFIASAQATELQSHFDSLVKPSGQQGEFNIVLSINQTATLASELVEILHSIDELEDIDIIDLSVSSAMHRNSIIEKAVDQLGLSFDGFYCSAFKGFNDSTDYETGVCGKLVRELLGPFLSTKGLFRAKTVYVEGNNYGNLIYSYLLLETQSETIVLKFDIVHEI